MILWSYTVFICCCFVVFGVVWGVFLYARVYQNVNDLAETLRNFKILKTLPRDLCRHSTHFSSLNNFSENGQIYLQNPQKQATASSLFSILGRQKEIEINFFTGDIILGICYRPLKQEDQADEVLYRQKGAASCSHVLVLTGNFNLPSICWRDNTASHRQFRRFLECVGGNFLLQVTGSLGGVPSNQESH